MKIEFYDKETGKAVLEQTNYLVDNHGIVYELIPIKGLYNLDGNFSISWRVVEK